MEKDLILFEEYKAGFSQIVNLVSKCEGIANESQKRFLEVRKDLLARQLEELKKQENEMNKEIKKFLVKATSELKVLRDLESYLIEQLKQCEEIGILVEKTESNGEGKGNK